jgi:hypothetical protein
MSVELKPLNIKFPPSMFTWREQRFLILASAGLSLFVVMPSSLILAVCTLLIGTPLFWLIFGSTLVFSYTSGMPVVRFFVIVTLVYFVAKLLAWAVPEFAKLLAGYGIA